MHFLFSFCEDEDPGTILGGMPMVFQESKRFVPKIGRHGLSSFGVRQPWQRDREAMDMPRGILVTSDGGRRIVKKKTGVKGEGDRWTAIERGKKPAVWRWRATVGTESHPVHIRKPDPSWHQRKNKKNTGSTEMGTGRKMNKASREKTCIYREEQKKEEEKQTVNEVRKGRKWWGY